MTDLRARLLANGASDLAIAWRIDHDPMRRDFLRGAEAMRERILAGIRRWWGNAKKMAGHRWPGHPHWLESAVAGIDAEQLLHPPDGPSDASSRDAERLGQRVDGGATGASGMPAQRPDLPGADA